MTNDGVRTNTTNTKDSNDAKNRQIQHPNDHQPKLVEVKGVRLKYFEQVLCKLLQSSSSSSDGGTGSNLEPKYIALPTPPQTLPGPQKQQNGCSYDNENIKYADWDSLPEAARVYGTLPGQLSNPQRAKRKEDQIKSMIRCILALLPPTTTTTKEKEEQDDNKENKYTIVDFCGGSGSLSIPLALMLGTKFTIVVVDLKQKSLDFLHEKASRAYQAYSSSSNTNAKNKTTEATTTTTTDEDQSPSSSSSPSPSRLQSTAIPNLFTFSGDIQSYHDPFHMGVALHACGEASDLVLRKCIQAKAQIVVAPCCVGKTSTTAKDPYIYAATKQNYHTIHYPQSKQFQLCLPCNTKSDNNGNNNDWNALAKAADFNEYLDMKQRRNASRRTAKSLLELDRKLYLEETNQYQTALTRMDPISASPKNDILLAHYTGASVSAEDDDENGHHQQTDTTRRTTMNPFLLPPAGHALVEDPVVTWTKAHLLHPGAVIEQELQPKDDNEDGTAASGLTTTPPPSTTSSPGKKKLKMNNNMTANDKKQPQQHCQDGVDWTIEEEKEIRAQLTERFSFVAAETTDAASTAASSSSAATGYAANASSNTTVEEPFVFPAGMGRRKRKLIHFVADQLGLAHWCVGKKQSDKTVAVRRRYVSR